MKVDAATAARDVALELAREGFTPPGEKRFGSKPAWAALRSLGSELWLDTGDLEVASRLWTDDFSNLTTNNTLVNKEVQKGLFDEVIFRAGRTLRDACGGMDTDQMVSEVAFVVNCRQALMLVQELDARVSVELHPALANDVPRTVEYARRYHEVCPDRFVVKVPLTPAGYVATRQLSSEGVPVNFTLGFSARQNVLAAAFSRPVYVNVFMGRLNSFVADGGLGDGRYVGEKATMATQVAIRDGRGQRGWTSRLIGASMRSAQQVRDLAGLDVFTMPTSVAEEWLKLYDPERQPVTDQVGREFEVEAEPASVLDSLWHVDDALFATAAALAAEDTSGWSAREFVEALHDYGRLSLFHDWTPEELQRIQADGKIPNWDYWKDALTSGQVALDDLMSVSALYSFASDQQALDARIQKLLSEAGLTG